MRYCVLLLLFFGQTAFGFSNKESSIDDYNVIWDSPSENQDGSMPIGNGETGANVWVEPNGDLVFLISRTDSWDENERPCKLGRVRVKFTPSLAANNFKQELKLKEGEIEITGGEKASPLKVRFWVDAHDQVIHVDADSEKAFEAQVSLELWRTERFLEDRENNVHGFKKPKVYPDTVITGQSNRIAWYHRNVVSPWEETLRLQGLESFIKIGKDPLLHRTFGGVIKADGLVNVDDKRLRTEKPQKNLRLSIHTHTESSATEAQWLTTIHKNIAAADSVNQNKALQAHRFWWADFWNRSWVFAEGNPDAEVVTRGYVLQRWISACAGRGNYPIKFNGSIFTVNPAEGYRGIEVDPDFRRWAGCYWFQNTRLPYWPMLASGDYDMMRPLFKMYRETLLLAKIRNLIYFGHDGAFFPETMSFWGTYNNGGWGWGWRTTGKPGDPTVNPYIRFHYSGTLELLAMMIDYYDHTADKEFLADELLPIADEFLLWWDKHWARGDDGKLNMYPSYACESFWNCTNPTPDVAGLMWNIDKLLSLSDKEIGTERRARWKAFRKEIPDIPMTEIDGKPVIAEAEGELPNPTNSENPKLYAVFPFRIYGVGKDDLEVARHSFNTRRVKGSIGWRQDETQAAFLGLTDNAAVDLTNRAKDKHDKSRFPAFWGPNFDWIPDQDHGGNLLMAFQTMVMQADDGKIRLLPAWPKEWDLDFKLNAPGNTTVQGQVKDGKLCNLKVTPESRKKDVVNCLK